MSSVKKKAVLLVLAALSTTVVTASTFVYLPMNASMTAVQPAVIFEAGENAGQADIGTGNTIDVTVGAKNSSATISLHPTWQRTYYKDILRISNKDTGQSYNVWINVKSASIQGFATVTMIIKEVGTDNVIATVDLGTTGAVFIGSIAAGSSWYIDFETNLPEDQDSGSASISMDLIYTPSSETPP